MIRGAAASASEVCVGEGEPPEPAAAVDRGGNQALRRDPPLLQCCHSTHCGADPRWARSFSQRPRHLKKNCSSIARTWSANSGPVRRAHTSLAKGDYTRLLKNRFMNYAPRELVEIGRRVHADTLRQLEDTARQIDPNKTWMQLLQENWLDHPAPWLLHSYLKQEAERARKITYDQLVNVPAGLAEEYRYIDAGHYRNRSRMGYGAASSFQGSTNMTLYHLPSTDQYSVLTDKIELMLDWNRGWIIGAQIPHEVYPGHHFQSFMSSQNKRPARALVRRGLFTDVNSGFTEGWGVYGEDAMFDAGYQRNDLRLRLTQLQNRYWRTARIIIDPSVHTQGMTFEEAVRVFVEAGLPEGGARLEALVVSKSPTREASYYIGKMEIEALRDEYKKRRGSSFDLKEFHTTLLLLGATPPKLARMEMLESGK